MNIIQLYFNKMYQEATMIDLTTTVLAMVTEGRIDTKSAAQLLDVLWSVDGRSFRVPRYL